MIFESLPDKGCIFKPVALDQKENPPVGDLREDVPVTRRRFRGQGIGLFESCERPIELSGKILKLGGAEKAIDLICAASNRGVAFRPIEIGRSLAEEAKLYLGSGDASANDPDILIVIFDCFHVGCDPGELALCDKQFISSQRHQCLQAGVVETGAGRQMLRAFVRQRGDCQHVAGTACVASEDQQARKCAHRAIEQFAHTVSFVFDRSVAENKGGAQLTEPDKRDVNHLVHQFVVTEPFEGCGKGGHHRQCGSCSQICLVGQ